MEVEFGGFRSLFFQKEGLTFFPVGFGDERGGVGCVEQEFFLSLLDLRLLLGGSLGFIVEEGL